MNIAEISVVDPAEGLVDIVHFYLTDQPPAERAGQACGLFVRYQAERAAIIVGLKSA